MSSIHYICLSDMHLGEEDSLLTKVKPSGKINPGQASPVMEQLAQCLASLISETNGNGKKPTLVLSGDILEIALARTNEAAMVFERFIEETMVNNGKLFEEIVYIPGNHDHHFWEVARERQYTKGITPDAGKVLKPPKHTTDIFLDDADRVRSHFLTNLVRRVLGAEDFTVKVAYPNFGFSKRIADDRMKCVVFHHGHFVEPLYQLMSKLRTLIFADSEMPTEIENIEAQNFAWIDFFWSTMGRSGAVGKDVEAIYEKIGDEKQLKKLISNLAKGLADEYDIPYIPGDWAEAKALKAVLTWAAMNAAGERKDTSEDLSEEAEHSLSVYVNGPLKKQIKGELGEIPSDVTFVFGHTHKPFQEDRKFKEYKGWVNVYNTGGWVVESTKPEVKRGAAIVMLDEDLNATSLRVYNEADDPSKYLVKVEESRHVGERSNLFHEQILESVEKHEDKWKALSVTIADEVYTREQNLRARIDSEP